VGSSIALRGLAGLRLSQNQFGAARGATIRHGHQPGR